MIFPHKLHAGKQKHQLDNWLLSLGIEFFGALEREREGERAGTFTEEEMDFSSQRSRKQSGNLTLMGHRKIIFLLSSVTSTNGA